MADTNNLNLPPIVDGKSAPSEPGGGTPIAGTPTTEQLPPEAGQVSQKTYMIGGGIVVVLALLLLFIKRGYANYLISMKRSPNQSDTASWALFGTLLFPAIAVGLGYIKGADALMTLPYLAPLAIGMLVCLVLTVILSGKKK